MIGTEEGAARIMEDPLIFKESHVLRGTNIGSSTKVQVVGIKI